MTRYIRKKGWKFGNQIKSADNVKQRWPWNDNNCVVRQIWFKNLNRSSYHLFISCVCLLCMLTQFWVVNPKIIIPFTNNVFMGCSHNFVNITEILTMVIQVGYYLDTKSRLNLQKKGCAYSWIFCLFSISYIGWYGQTFDDLGFNGRFCIYFGFR